MRELCLVCLVVFFPGVLFIKLQRCRVFGTFWSQRSIFILHVLTVQDYAPGGDTVI